MDCEKGLWGLGEHALGTTTESQVPTKQAPPPPAVVDVGGVKSFDACEVVVVLGVEALNS